MSEWQPIETAPKNVPILVFTNSGDVDVAVWDWKAGHFSNNARGDVVWREEWSWWDNPHTGGWESEWIFNSDGSDLTHWMPLPEPPALLLQAGKGEKP